MKSRKDLENVNRELSEKLDEASRGLQDARQAIKLLQQQTKELIFKKGQREIMVQKALALNKNNEEKIAKLRGAIFFKDQESDERPHPCYKDAVIFDLSVRLPPYHFSHARFLAMFNCSPYSRIAI